VQILETERLILREITADDAEFTIRLLNSPSFLRYIGDRGVRSEDDAREFIETRYRKSYHDNGYGLYIVESKDDRLPVGICGFVKRETLPRPDIGFAFLPEYERKGYGFESASAVMDLGRRTLGFDEVLAITTVDNDASGRLLAKLGFTFDRNYKTPEGETLKLFKCLGPGPESSAI
jgi:RimJ/RimL family protein N-acetyltransferase